MPEALQNPPSRLVPNVVLTDPANPVTPQPLIADILRTSTCVPGSIFLVEGIDAPVPVRERWRAVRLLLGDGELCVQALLRADMHGLVDAGLVYAGCYVRVDSFELRVVDLEEASADVMDDKAGDSETSVPKDEAGRKTKMGQKMVYLVIGDLVTVGWNDAYLEMLGQPRKSTVKDVAGEPPVERSLLEETPVLASMATATTTRAHTPQSKEDVEDECDVDADPDDAFEVMDVSLPRATQRRNEHHDIQTGQKVTGQLSWVSSNLTKPLKLAQLHSIPNLPYKQNWTVNVLAIVASLSDVEPSYLPPYSQRTARLTDPTTTKKVLLTVFLEPESFNPKVGSVVLLLGVKNHRFDGGCLKKYASDQPRKGTQWWHEDPRELEWCDVAGLKKWWNERDG